MLVGLFKKGGKKQKMDNPNVDQDPSQTVTPKPGDPSAEPKGTPSPEPETFTKEDRDKAVSDALSAAGRDAKSITEKTGEAEKILKAAQKAQTDQEEAQERWQKEQD